MGLLDGKVAVVTGAGRGIGRAVARAFAAEGASLVLAARSAAEIESAAHEIRAAHGAALAIPTDVTRQEQIDALFARAVEQFGQVDILVNNAADIGPTGMLWEVDLAGWQAIFEVNLFSIVRGCRAALPGMIARRSGKIINVGSDAGWSESWAAEFPEQAAYGTTKAAVARFSQILAQQVKRYGINVNCLGVSAHTRMGYEANVAIAGARGSPPPDLYDAIPPEQRVLPEENAGAFLFLASSLSDHLSGAYFEANHLPDLLRDKSRESRE
jgi:NAD(P)-dependent dehydrogenase (short-subunit alcohol dehydrogenase family)